MFVIFGTKTISKTVKEGTFDCKRCQKKRNYKLKQNRRYFSLFFIPIIPLNNIGDILECVFCKTAYVPNSVLSKKEYTSDLITDKLENPLASNAKRIAGFFIDLIILVLINFPLAFVVDKLPEFFKNKFYLIFIPLWILYFFLMEWLFKGTIGKKIVSIETISESKEESVSIFQYLIRSIVKVIPLINIIFLFNEERKGVHDYIAKTIVIEK